jgi:hypothetical protein
LIGYFILVKTFFPLLLLMTLGLQALGLQALGLLMELINFSVRTGDTNAKATFTLSTTVVVVVVGLVYGSVLSTTGCGWYCTGAGWVVCGDSDTCAGATTCGKVVVGATVVVVVVTTSST